MTALLKERLFNWLPLAAILALASVLLFWELDEKYLWQDEANTAVLATRILRFGKPLAWDGVNFLSLDDIVLEDPASIGQRTHSSRGVVDYYVGKHYLKPDTTWKWSPWGQFLVAAASIRLLGQTTLAARLPFALAGLLTVLALYRLALLCCGRLTAQLGAFLLTLNVYWILHSRQARYYPLTGLFFLLTLMGYMRWKRGEKWGAAAFIGAAWCWFECDFGTIVPVLAVLFLDSALTFWRRPRGALVVWTSLAVSIAPFAWYYEIWGRLGGRLSTWHVRLALEIYNLNEYIAALPVLAVALGILLWRRNNLRAAERQVIGISLGSLAAIAIWVPVVAPVPFLRYSIALIPAGCLVAGWVVARMGSTPLAWAAACVLAFTPIAGWPTRLVVHPPEAYQHGVYVRREFLRLADEIFNDPEDLNRDVIGWIRDNVTPSGAILINYEDVPLMYYLPNPIRGGIASYRAEYDAVPPEVMILRTGIPLTQWAVFQREFNRYHWKQYELPFAPVLWGNNPDPNIDPSWSGQMQLIVARRIP